MRINWGLVAVIAVFAAYAYYKSHLPDPYAGLNAQKRLTSEQVLEGVRHQYGNNPPIVGFSQREQLIKRLSE